MNSFEQWWASVAHPKSSTDRPPFFGASEEAFRVAKMAWEASREPLLSASWREAERAAKSIYFSYLQQQFGGSMSKIARRAGIDRTHLYRVMKVLGFFPKGNSE